jgi:RNA polymerase sigma factor (sigma-70 family)
MKPRHGTVEIFSTFLQLDADYFKGWVTDPKLRRSMQHCVDQAPQLESERVWMLYWHQFWQAQSSPLASAHLAAALQEVCYWTARKITTNFARQQSVADLFQSAIVGLPKVLKTFNRALNSNLKSYAELIFGNLIKDSLRKNQEIDICTDWSLLNRLSQKALVEALQSAGLSEQAIAAHVLTWTCFHELAAPSGAKATRKQSKPDREAWLAIAQLYNTQRLTQLRFTSPETTPEHIEKRLLTCAASVRAFRLPSVISANTPQYQQETVELLDNLPSLEEPLLNEMIAHEETTVRQSQTGQIKQVLEAAIGQLDPQQQTLLKTYYGQDLTQQQIAQQLGVKQYSISRRLTSARGALVRALAQWSQDTLHLSLTPEVLDSINAGLEEWLKERVKSEIFS